MTHVITDPNDAVHPAGENDMGGITIRQHFAAMAMAATLTASHGQYGFHEPRPENVAVNAVRYADALIAELNKKGETKS